MVLRKIKKFFNNIFHGLKGSAIFFMIGVMFFALWKLVYIIASEDLLLSKYFIAAVIGGMIIIGFIYGMIAFKKKNHHYKLYRMTKKNFIINLVLTIIFTAYFWYILKNKLLPSTTIYLLFIIAFILFYAFSALISSIHTHIKKKQHHKIKKSTIVLAIIFNPIFVLIYLWLFGIVMYNAVYIPCGVSAMGVDKNAYTGNTRNLGINSNDRIIAIDGNKMTSLQDVRDYMNSLEVTKEVVVETLNSTYLVKTYQIDGKRYMGLLLREQVCLREY